MTRPRGEEGGSADVTTPFGRARLRGRIPHSWFFIVNALGLFTDIAFTIHSAPQPLRVLVATLPAYLLLWYLIHCFTGLVRTHADALAGDPPTERILLDRSTTPGR